MTQSLILNPQQNQAVVVAVAAGKTIAANVSPCPGGGFVWPHFTANGVPIQGSQMTPKQAQAFIDNSAAGKSGTVSFKTGGTGRNEVDFS